MSRGQSKKNIDVRPVTIEVDPTECPFREFRDNELAPEYWGMGPAACRHAVINKVMTKLAQDVEWVDEQTQPLPRSVRQYLHGWVRAEVLAADRWDAEVVIFEDINHGKLSVMDTQLSHTQVLLRSSFCRRVLSTCYILERVEGFQIEHTWENFAFNFGPEGWRARYHIYSPGMKAGGGQQHRPVLSKNGCYLVRLYYLGAWRCVWVSDQVPVDGFDSPLLPFSPLLSHSTTKNPKAVPTLVTSSVVHLWPLLLCKALLKLAAPDMNDDEEELVDDEVLPEFDLFHALTGCMSLTYHIRDAEQLWALLTSEVHNFTWDEDDETVVSTIKSKGPVGVEILGGGLCLAVNVIRLVMIHKVQTEQRAVTTMLIADTKDCPPYALPGITPAHEMKVIVTMTRDLPLKKPLPEPDVSPWKLYRWVEWARSHGLYEAYECPRTRFVKVNGLMKLSYAPHLLDVQSTESITYCFREEQEKNTPAEKRKKLQQQQQQQAQESKAMTTASNIAQQKEELREWVQYVAIQPLVLQTNLFYYPSIFNYTSTASHPPVRITKAPLPKNLDIAAPKSAPLYLQIDGPGVNKLLISMSMLHPRILLNSRSPMEDFVEKAYVLLEVFEWFKEKELPRAKAYIETRGYGSVECFFPPGRHFCRLWIHSRTNWHVAAMSETSLVLGTRDAIQTAACRECPWAHKFLLNLQQCFNNWIRQGRSFSNMLTMDHDFFAAYQPDLPWDPEVVGYKKCYVHWMFRQALQSLLQKRMLLHEFRIVCPILRYYFSDPDFGMPPKPTPAKPLTDIIAKEPCDCLMPEAEENNFGEEEQAVQVTILAPGEQTPLVSNEVMSKLLLSPVHPATSNVCELASEQVPCALLKTEREKLIRKHEAATLLQAHWRGAWARKCLRTNIHLTPEVNKLLMENAFGNLDALSFLMNEFFMIFPGVKYAYSVSSALSGVYGLNQHSGSSPMFAKCRWIPYFQGVFFCHHNVKVHFDIQSTIPCSALAVYDNDTGERLPQAHNAHLTFNFVPNIYGYTVLGHGTLSTPPTAHGEVHWQLTVMASIDNVFHICDNPETDLCTIFPLQPASKLHLNEMFIPNRRNILGGIQIAVTKVEAVSFRAESTQPDLDIVAVLRTTDSNGHIEEIARCNGKGEIFWPYIRLKPSDSVLGLKKRSVSHALLPIHSEQTTRSGRIEVKSAKGKPSSAKNKSSATKVTAKLKEVKPAPVEPKQYTIEVIAVEGWALSLEQWKRVDEVRNSLEAIKVDVPSKKGLKDKGVATKDKSKTDERDKSPIFMVHQPLPDDAYTVLECSTAVGGGAIAKRDDERDVLFATTRRSWEMKEPGRNLRGEKIREAFRAEHLVVQSVTATKETSLNEIYAEESEHESGTIITASAKESRQRPSPVTESGMLEMSIEPEEEMKYYNFPEPLRDKFVPLYFVPLCTKDKVVDESVLLTPEIAKAAQQERHEHIEASLARMSALQTHNEVHMLDQQQTRIALLEKLYTDAQWGPDLAMALDERDATIVREIQETQLASKKKQQEKEKEKNLKPEPKRK